MEKNYARKVQKHEMFDLTFRPATSLTHYRSTRLSYHLVNWLPFFTRYLSTHLSSHLPFAHVTFYYTLKSTLLLCHHHLPPLSVHL